MDRRVTLHKHKEHPETSVSTNTEVLPEVDKELAEGGVKAADTLVLEETDAIRPVTPVTIVQDTHIVGRRKREEKHSVSGSFCSVSEPKKRNRSLSWTSSVASADITPINKMNGGKIIKRERQARKEKSRKRKTKTSGMVGLNILVI